MEDRTSKKSVKRLSFESIKTMFQGRKSSSFQDASQHSQGSFGKSMPPSPGAPIVTVPEGDPWDKAQLRLSNMLSGIYLTSWKDMLVEMEIKDDNIRRKYREENEGSTLLDQERRYPAPLQIPLHKCLELSMQCRGHACDSSHADHAAMFLPYLP